MDQIDQTPRFDPDRRPDRGDIECVGALIAHCHVPAVIAPYTGDERGLDTSVGFTFELRISATDLGCHPWLR